MRGALRLQRHAVAAAAIWLSLTGCGGDALDGGLAVERAAGEVRNVVLVSLDTLRPDHLGAYGYDRPTSPFIDRLAGEGVVFEAAISQAPWTLPSHGALLCSAYPSTLGEGPWEVEGRIPQEAYSIAEVLAEGGLRTRAFVNGGFLRAYFGLAQGFERWTEIDQGSNSFQLTVTRALRWLDTQLGADERFFLFLHTYDIHEYLPDEASAADLVGPYGGWLTDLDTSVKQVLQQRRLDTEGLLPALGPADLEHVRDRYDATIRGVDRELERLWTGLEERGLADATLLILTSDHGEEFLEHGSTGHGYTLHDENLRVPLILVHPSLAARRVPAQVRLIDLAPTMAALLGFEAPVVWQGRSLLEPDLDDRPAFSQIAHEPFVSLRTGRHKLIRGEGPSFALFDLARDPGELQDLSGRGEPAEPLLRAELERWVEGAGAWPPPGPAEPDAMAPELLEELRALGYLGDG